MNKVKDTLTVPMTQERRAQIAAIIQERGSARVNELAEKFQVSEVTIRSDLGCLEKQGHVTRDHGGATAANPVAARRLTALLGIEQRASLNLDAKRRIARAAAATVRPGDTVLLDAGTTVVEMARHLADVPSLTIVTNALNVAEEAGALTDARVILLGGTLGRESSSLLGPLAEQALGDLVVEKLFLGTQAFDQTHGLTDTTMEIAQIKRAMIRSARQVTLLSDSTKWARSGFIKVAPLTAAQTVISDTDLDEEARAAIERLGIELRLV